MECQQVFFRGSYDLQDHPVLFICEGHVLVKPDGLIYDHSDHGFWCQYDR